MMESQTDFSFRKLIANKFLTLEVMTYIEHPEVLNWMFSINKSTRHFIKCNFINIRNAFINEGLIIYKLKSDFYHYE